MLPKQLKLLCAEPSQKRRFNQHAGALVPGRLVPPPLACHVLAGGGSLSAALQPPCYAKLLRPASGLDADAYVYVDQLLGTGGGCSGVALDPYGRRLGATLSLPVEHLVVVAAPQF